MVDVDSAKWSSMAGTATLPLRWVYAREARVLGAFEREATRRARLTYVVNARERETLTAIAGPGSRVEVLENGVDLARLAPREAPPESQDVVFCGVMNYAPNEEGARWLATSVWPARESGAPDARAW